MLFADILKNPSVFLVLMLERTIGMELSVGAVGLQRTFYRERQGIAWCPPPTLLLPFVLGRSSA